MDMKQFNLVLKTNVKSSQTNLQKDMLQKQTRLLSASLSEIRDVNVDEYEVGQEVKVDIFAAGDIVDVTGYQRKRIPRCDQAPRINPADQWLMVHVFIAPRFNGTC